MRSNPSPSPFETGRSDASLPLRASAVRGAWAGAVLPLALLLWFGALGFRDLITPDEGRYAELARAMLASGDWITPRLDGLAYFEKPPFQYWATAIAFRLFGLHEWSARLWPALAGAIAVAATWSTVRRHAGMREALYAACVLAASAWWIANAHFLTLDMGLAAPMTLALLGFWHAQRDDAGARENQVGMLVCWAALAVATLTKGPVALVLSGGALVIHSAIERDAELWRRMRWTSGLLLYALIAVPWFVRVGLRNPDFVHFFFVHEHIERFLTTEHRRAGPIWYYLPVLAVGLLPWTSLLPSSLRQGWRRVPGRFQPYRLAVVWSAVVFCFFNASGSKLPGYILPMFPALALLIGRRIDALPAAALARHTALPALCGVALLLLAALLPAHALRLEALPSGAFATMRLWLGGAGLMIASASMIAAFALRRARKSAAVITLALGSVAGVQMAMFAHQSLARVESAKQMVAALQGLVTADAPFYAVGLYDQSLPFYLGRPVTLVAWQDEFALGERIEPERWIASIEAFEARWRTEPGAAAMMRPATFAALRAHGMPMREVYRDGRRVVAVALGPPQLSAVGTPSRTP